GSTDAGVGVVANVAARTGRIAACCCADAAFTGLACRTGDTATSAVRLVAVLGIDARTAAIRRSGRTDTGAVHTTLAVCTGRIAAPAEPTGEDTVVRLGRTGAKTTGFRPIGAVEADATRASGIPLLAGHCDCRERKIPIQTAVGADVDHADVQVAADAALRDEVIEEGEPM